MNAIRGEDGRKMGVHRLRVHLAKQDKNYKPSHHAKPDPPFKAPNQKTQPRPSHKAFRDHRSYKDVSLNQIQFKTHHPEISNRNLELHLQSEPHRETQKIPPNEPAPQPDCFMLEPNQERRLSSRILGEATEKIRDDLMVKTINGEEHIVVKGSKTGDNEELFSRSVVATANSSLSSVNILEHILAEGVTCLTIKTMGGMLHLISFESKEDKKAMLESDWLSRWFMDIREVNESCASKWRETTIKIYGVPLSGWGYDNFYKIGNIFGRILSVDYANFDCPKVTIITDCLFAINCKLVMELGDQNYITCISEECRCQQKDQKNSPMETIQSSDEEEGACNTPISLVGNEQMTPQFLHEIQDPPFNDDMEPCNNNEVIINLFSPQAAHLENQTSPQLNPSDNPEKTFRPPSNQCPSESSHQSHHLSPSQSKSNPVSTTLSKIIVSPQKSPVHHSPKSPVSLANKFGPLRKSQTSSSISSFSSGPLYPPGFEDEIPIKMKKAHAEKRARKALKKLHRDSKRVQSSSLASKHPQSPIQSFSQPITVSSSDVLTLANQIGLKFDGPPEVLQGRIEAILKRQFNDWRAAQ